MNVARAKCLALLAVSGWLSLFSLSSFGQSANVTTTSTTVSSEIGAVNANYVWTTLYVGSPTTINVGTLTGCTLSSAGPYLGCSSGGGVGTPADPLVFSCTSAPPVTGCTGGTPFLIAVGFQDIDTRIHSVRVAAVVTAAAQPVPLGPWVPLLSTGGVLLSALWLRRRRNGHRYLALPTRVSLHVTSKEGNSDEDDNQMVLGFVHGLDFAGPDAAVKLWPVGQFHHHLND